MAENDCSQKEKAETTAAANRACGEEWWNLLGKARKTALR